MSEVLRFTIRLPQPLDRDSASGVLGAILAKARHHIGGTLINIDHDGEMIPIKSARDGALDPLISSQRKNQNVRLVIPDGVCKNALDFHDDLSNAVEAQLSI